MNSAQDSKQIDLNLLKLDYQAARETDEFKNIFTKAAPLISVCISTYNRADLLLQRSLQSLINQSFKNLQIVIVGDACTDDTEAQLAKLKDSRITFHNLKVRGPYPRPGMNRWLVAGTNAVNRAIELAEGDFITHLDDDDWASPDRLEVLIQAALETRSEFLWHQFLTQNSEGLWKTLGSEDLVLGQVTTGSIFYHKYFARIKWDLYAFREQEPGDWNRIRKIKFLEPRMSYVKKNLLLHYREQMQPYLNSDEQFLEF